MSSDGVVLEDVKQSAWKVELPDEEYWILRSPEFPFEGIKYRLELFTDWKSPGWIFQKLYIKGPSVAGPARIVRWQVGVKHGDDVGIQWIGNGEDSIEEACPGWSSLREWKLFERSKQEEKNKDLQTRERFTVVLQMKAGLTAMEASTQTDISSHCLLVLGQNLQQLYQDAEDCDVTIEVGDTLFRAHRAILKARSPVLAAAFRNEMEELKSGVIRVEDCEPNAFAVFLLFLYTGTVENMTTENVMDVYYIAEKYMLRELKWICVQNMLSTLSVRSICNTISFATFHRDRELLGKAIEFFMENAQEILPTVEWQRFMNENSTQANELYIKTLRGTTQEK